MKGVINKGIQELLETKFCADTWAEVKKRAGCKEPFFAASMDYPDETSIALIMAASEVTGLSPEAVQLEFGKFWVANTCKNSYPTLFQVAGSSPREFLLNMNKVHLMVMKNVAGATPPQLEYGETADGKLIIYYQSKRKLCAVMRGLILGVGVLFNQELQVEETECVQQGAPRCVMEVNFHG